MRWIKFIIASRRDGEYVARRKTLKTFVPITSKNSASGQTQNLQNCLPTPGQQPRRGGGLKQTTKTFCIAFYSMSLILLRS